MVLCLCSAFPTTPPSPHVDLSASRTLLPFDTYIFAQNHKFHFCAGYLRQLLALILNGTPLVFCLPNDSTLASCGLASFENTLAIWDTCFCPNHKFEFLHRISATIHGLNKKWHSAYVLPSQRHRPRLMWTFQLREHSLFFDTYVLPKITNSTFDQNSCDNAWP